MPLIVADLITLAFVTAIVSNPRIWGIPMIALTLCSWISVQVLRYFVGKPTMPISAGVQIAITTLSFFQMVSNPDYPEGYKTAVVALIIWVVAEMAWFVIERKHFSNIQ